jgi:hypothetical protein
MVRKGDSPVAMTTVTSHPASLRQQVRDLRERGMSVKQIARTLGVSASDIAPLVNAIAAEDSPPEMDPGVVGCWVSPGWSIDLTVHGHPEWRDTDDTADFPGGIAAVLVARRHRTNRVSVCGYLVDTYCLGVKNALGPRVLRDRDLPAFVHVYFDGFEPAGPPLRAPLELARHLVYGGVEAARWLGFDPHADFAAAAGHLGPWTGNSAITFGENGAPFYLAGPYDNAGAVIATLTETVGEDNFTLVTPVDSAGLSA